ncbi:MAG: LacI family DNA-binding transcriptional regulator [Rubrivivax sp.]|nr:LacI family DNA-binding transcriptional regulator [Rubrivivax sp.]
MPVSSIEVARLAGVSQAAVSRVFTPGASVSDEMRARVLAAARQLGYRPNAIARSLIQRSTRMIGLVLVRFMNPFYARLLQEFTARLQALGYWTLLLNVAHGDELEKTLPTALQYQVDGLIVTSATLSSRLADECAHYGTPVVLFNRYSLDSNVNAVCCDSVRGARLVADALIDAGHQRFAYIAGEAGSSTNQDRERGFTARLRERGHALALSEQGDYSYESGIVAARRLLDRSDRPDAIFCANDLMAMAALDVARCELGLRVPEELSVVGFDDIQQASWPKYDLTTVRQPVERMVEATIELLLNAIENPDGERILRMIPPTLAVRGSARRPQPDNPAT